MTLDNHDNYIKYRFNRAKESLEEAIILAEKEKWNTVINRLYYASFYAVVTLLLKNNIETQSHDGARIQFALNFIKTQKIDIKWGKFFSKLYDFRQKGDYGDLFDFDEEIARPLIEQTRQFIFEIEQHL